MPKFYRYLFLLIFLFLLASWGVGVYWNSQVHQAVDAGDAETREFVIQSGENGQSVGKRLAREKFIKSPLFFRLYLRLQNSQGTHIQAGKYALSSSMTAAEIVDKISAAGSFETKITFVEGWRVEEMVEQISSKSEIRNSKLKVEEFYELAKSQRGYLFPDTYFIDRNTTADELIEKMRANFDEKYLGVQEDIENEGLTREEAVIFASIVEREVAKDGDRPIVAGILLKRWRNGWPLEADVTVQFAIANRDCGVQSTGHRRQNQDNCTWWKKDLTQQDLEIDSPYNTRQNTGLPPTPISNPGLNALKAVVNPQQTPYWYYLTDKNGITHYAATLAEHNANIQTYLR